ncbi:MAG: ADP-ribosylation factor-like protein, partial [Ferruginibacter sp.]
SDFYFDPISQIKIDQWSKGRVSLVGDACYCPSLLSGKGSTLAMVGAYIFAGELKLANGNHKTAYKEYFKGLEQGSISEYESKIILVGNGRVGKTCIVNRWLEDRFDESEESTHAIILKSKKFPEIAAKNKLKSLRLNIWDFGGQDIYYATHQYFMQTNAIFLLVWDADTENHREQVEEFATGKKVKYKNYSIRYWLSYIKTLSKNSAVIIIQTKRDSTKNKAGEPEFTNAEKKAFNIKAILAVESGSDETDNGFDELKSKIFKTVAEELKRNNAPLPAQWFAVKEKIWQIQEENKKKREEQRLRQMTLEKFSLLYREQNMDNKGAEVLLEYFHNSVLFFYKKGLFGNKIVLDQQWAINAVYRIQIFSFQQRHLFVHFIQGYLISRTAWMQ